MGPLWEMADLITPMAIRVAATLRLGDELATGPASVDDLAKRVVAHPDTLGRVLRHLAMAGLLDEAGPGRYQLTELGRGLQGGGLRDWLDINGAVGRADLAFMRLLDTVRQGGPAYPIVYGRDFWEDLDATPALSDSLDELMGDHPAVPDVLDGYDWAAVQRVADVGGGNGTLLVALLLAHDHLEGILVERAGPADAARHSFTEAGLAGRCTVVAGSFFDPIPTGADVYVLSRVINDWDDDHAVAILRRCAEAAGRSARILVVEEGAIDSPYADDMSTAMDLRMLVFCGGRERTLTDLHRLSDSAGLAVASVHTAFQASLVELAAA